MYKVYFLLIFFSIQNFYAQDIFSIARNGTLNEIELLLKENPKAINLINENGFSPLILACYRGNIAVAKFLIDNGASVNNNCEMGTALMAATVKGNFEIVKILLEKKANPDISDSNGTTALIYAVQFKNLEVLKLLLNFNADKSKKDKSGKTAFEYAVFSGDETIINLLK